MQHATLGIMENKTTTDKGIQARDSATRMLNRLTARLAFGAVAACPPGRPGGLGSPPCRVAKTKRLHTRFPANSQTIEAALTP